MKPDQADIRQPTEERPLAWAELRDRTAFVEASEDVPKELQNMFSDLSRGERLTLQTIEKGKGEELPLADSYRPGWVASSLKPQRRPRLLCPRLEYRNVPVDPLVVWGADDRRTYNDTSYPWGCVCRVLSGGQGSGVLVGPRHVLTASHVVDWGGSASVEVHRAGGTVAASAQAIRGWAFTFIDNVGATTVDEDYAVLVTDQRLGDRFGWMGTRTYNSSWDDEDYWWSIGYPGDVAGSLFPVWQRDKELDEDEWDYGSGRAMTTAADLMSGQSGSPMFGFWSPGPYVVAVASAVGNIFLSGTENWCAGGSDLPRLVNHARQQDP